jgi:hypothetical protein
LVTLLQQELDPVERGLSLAALGDFSTVTGDPLAARDYYRQAWSILRADPEIDVAAYFAEPVMLDFVAPLNAVDRGTRGRPYAWAEVVLEFDISAEGRPADVRIVGGAAQFEPVHARYSRRLRETHFRPRLAAGEPVLTTNVRSTHYFRFYVEDDED